VKIAFSASVAAVAFGLLAESCGLAHADASRFTAQSGRELRLTFASDVKPDCSVGGAPVIHVINDAQHGRIRLQPEQASPSFAQDNPRSVCNQRRVAGVGVYYTSDKGYVGDDFVTLHYEFDDGGQQIEDYAITVKNDLGETRRPRPKAKVPLPPPSPAPAPTQP